MTSKGVRRNRQVKVSGSLPLPVDVVDLGGGAGIARHIEGMVVEDDALGYPLYLDLVYSETAERLIVEAMRTDDPEGFTPQLVRKLTLPDYPVFGIKRWGVTEVAPGQWQPGIERLDDEDESHFVARAYRIGVACGRGPTKAVAEMLDVAESTASAKVSLARKLGLLPKTTIGKARA